MTVTWLLSYKIKIPINTKYYATYKGKIHKLISKALNIDPYDYDFSIILPMDSSRTSHNET